MRRWTIFTIVAVVVVLAAGWLLLVKPQKSKISGYQTQAQTQLQANAQLLTQIAALQSEQSELPQEQLALQKFSTQIPNDAGEPTLIRQFSTAAHGSGVTLTTITPGAPVPVAASTVAGAQTLGSTASTVGALNSLPMSLIVAGSYVNIESFLESLEKLPRALLVTEIALAPGTQAATTGVTQLTATVSAQVFFTPPTPTAAVGTVPQTLAPATAPTTAATPGAVPTTAGVATQAAGQTS